MSEDFRSEERGSALVLTLLLVIALIALGTAFLSVSTTERTISSNNADSARAFNLAQAGIEDARVVLTATNLDTLLAGGGTLFTNKAMSGGSYTVTVANNIGPRFPDSLAAVDPGGATDDTDWILVLTSTGQNRKARRQSEVMVVVPNSAFSYAFWAQTKLTISGAGFTDAYNSSAGAYNPGSATNDGDVYAGTQLNLSGSSMVNGDAATSSATGPASGHVSGTTTVSAPTQNISAVNCPASFPTAASMPTGAGITYNAGTGALTVSGGGNNITLPIPPTSYYFSSVTLSGGATMTLSPTSAQHVDIYISGTATLSGGGIINTSAKPTALTFYACGAGTNNWVISGGSGAYFAIHAPTRKVTVSGGSDVYGAIIAKEIDDSGGSAMHFDQALAAGGGPAAVVQRSWREIFF